MTRRDVSLEIRPYTVEDKAAVEALNGEYYTTVHGFDTSFITVMSAALDKIEPAIADETGAGWIVLKDGQMAGSLFLSPDGDGAGRIRLFLLRADLQGCGLGAELLGRCIESGRTYGFHTLRVSTFTIHDAACGLYGRFGFTQTRQSQCHMFGRDLVQVDFERRSAVSA